MNTRLILASAVAAAFSVPAFAQEGGPAPTPTFEAEKCFGIAKAGSNDCAATGNNSCAGTSKVDADPKAWIFVPKGFCERIVNASLEPK